MACFRLLLCLLLLATTLKAQDRSVQQLLGELNSNPAIDAEYEIWFNLIQAYAFEGSLDSAVLVAQRALSAEYTQADPNRVGQIYYTLAYSYDINDQLSSALTNYERAKEAYQEADNQMWIAGSINAMGTANYFAGEYGEAVRLFYESLKYAEDHDLILEQVESLINIAAVYADTDRVREAIDNCLLAVELQQKLASTERLGYLYNYLGSYYLDLKMLDSTFHYLQAAERLFYDDLENPEMLGSTYTNLAVALLSQGDTMAAKANLSRGYDILQENRAAVPSLLFNLMQQGAIALAEGKTVQATELLEKALHYTENSERSEHQIEILKLLQKASADRGDTTAAYRYLHQSSTLADSVRTHDRDLMIAEMQAKYELREQEKQLEIQKIKIEQQRSTRAFLIILASLLFMGVVGLLLYLRSKNRTNRTLEAQKSIIESALAEKEILLKEIHHRVKNNLQVISSLLSLQSKTVEDSKAKEVLKEGQARVRSMALIHQNLYQGKDVMTVNTKTYITSLVEKLLQSYAISRDSELTLDLDIESFDLHVEQMVPLALIINELVSNSLKHAFKQKPKRGDRISVSLHEDAADLVLLVADNGVGIQDLSNFKNRSFGHRIISSFARKMKAEIDYLTDTGFGVEMRIPNYLVTPSLVSLQP